MAINPLVPSPSNASAPPPARRAHCPRCGRPQSVRVDACICRWVTPITPITLVSPVSPLASGASVLILQHPMETHNPKGTTRLLHLSLPGSQLLIGEEFARDVLHAALYGLGAPSAAGAATQPVLLYPADAGVATVSAADLAKAENLRLVVLDGTWRKSRKMLHANPLLQALPRLALTDVAPSRYVIRKAHAPHQLSTLEATCAALAQLSGEPGQFAPLLAAMDGWIVQQQQHQQQQARQIQQAFDPPVRPLT